MGFAHKGLWGMAYHSFMGYGVQFPANQVGGSIRLWDITGYGLCQVWVKAGSTVLRPYVQGVLRVTTDTTCSFDQVFRSRYFG